MQNSSDIRSPIIFFLFFDQQTYNFCFSFCTWLSASSVILPKFFKIMFFVMFDSYSRTPNWNPEIPPHRRPPYSFGKSETVVISSQVLLTKKEFIKIKCLFFPFIGPIRCDRYMLFLERRRIANYILSSNPTRFITIFKMFMLLTIVSMISLTSDFACFWNAFVISGWICFGQLSVAKPWLFAGKNLLGHLKKRSVIHHQNHQQDYLSWFLVTSEHR